MRISEPLPAIVNPMQAVAAEPFTAGPPVTYTGNGVPQVVSLSAGLPFATSITGETLRVSGGSGA